MAAVVEFGWLRLQQVFGVRRSETRTRLPLGEWRQRGDGAVGDEPTGRP
ncbi:hypothetical protein [Nocardia brasiliensis]